MPVSEEKTAQLISMEFSKLKEQLSDRAKEIFDRTIKLVNIQSVSNTVGETEVADHIYDEMKSWSYFKTHPDYLQMLPIEEDSLNRHSVVALVRGEKNASKETVIYMGHFDTVDVGEYGDLEAVACDPAALVKKFNQRDLPEDVKRDIESGEWVFGRGIADMKSGVAVLMQLLKEISQDIANFPGNIVLVIVGDEEADSRGMISVAKPLAELSRREDLNLLGAINTDMVCQLHESEPDHRYMYLGAMGKIVPAVYVVGKGAHVGESLQGFDANFLLSELTCRIDANMNLSDRYEDMVTYPPISLKQTDLKTDYNGQVPYEGYAYYNFLNYQRGPKEILELMKVEVEVCFSNCLGKLESANKEYFAVAKGDPAPLNLNPLVLSYEDLFSTVCEKLGSDAINAELDRVREEMNKEAVLELRDLTLAMVRSLWRLSGLSGPAAVVFIMPPYYPPNNPTVDTEKFAQFNQKATQIATTFGSGTEYNIEVRPFFPILSDASFCAYQDGQASRVALENNMPCWSRGWQIDIDNVLELNLPVFDMGVHGKDPHKLFERLHVPYAMETLPELIKEVTLGLLAG